MSSKDSNALRALTPIEQYFTSRDHLNIYHAPACCCRYSPAQSGTDVSEHFYASLGAVVSSQPVLRVGIANTATANSAYFTFVPAIDLHDHVRVVTVPVATGDEAAFNKASARIQADLHSEGWTDIVNRPPWRIVIIRSESGEAAFEDVLLLFHHALLDGMSSKLFHKHLLTALNTTSSSSSSSHKLSFDAKPALPLGQEDEVPAPVSFFFMVRTLWNELGPAALRPRPDPIWAGKNIDLSLPIISNITPVDISAANAKKLLAACKEHKTTLTGLIHAMVLSILSRRFPDTKFSCATPISLRQFAPEPSSETLRNLITSHTISLEPSTDIWPTATQIRKELTARIATLPGNDLATLSKYVSNWNDFLKTKDGTQRSSSWEVSNIGVLSPDSNTSGEEQKYKISRILFSNAGMPTGAAVGVNVCSVAGGTLTISLSWQKDVVEDEVVEGVAAGLMKLVDSFCERGEFE